MTEYLILLFLLGLSFFFSGTETAVTAVSKPLLHEHAKQGSVRAYRLNLLKNDSARLLGSLLLGNNVVNIAITALSTSMLIEVFGDHYGVLISTFVVSTVVLVFSEILPKTYAINNAFSFAMSAAPFLSVFVTVMTPIVNLLNLLSRQIMKLLPKSDQGKTSADEIKAEIRGALDLQTDDPDICQESGMLKSVLDLGDVTVEDIMIHRSQIISLNADLPLSEIFDFVSRSPFSRIPLWRGKRDNIIGILHSKALLRIMNTYYKGYKNIHIQDYTSKPWFVLNTRSLLDQLHAFKKRREHFALVVDEYGVLEGLVTLEDVLEEIVGDISDENDPPEESTLQIHKTDSGAFRLEGSATIRDINRHFKWELPDDNAATLAGYIMYETERIPTVGQSFVINGFTFTIVEKDKNRLALIDVIPPAR